MTDTTATQELVITRVFDAPRELVYRAFVDPDQLAAWFGPAGWSVPRDTVEIDARVGGHQRFTMVNDADPQMSSAVDATFTEVVENELLVGSQRADFGAGPIEFGLRVEFHDEDGRTRMVLRQGPYTPGMEGGAREGWNSSFGKLDALLAR
ncbi:SRPBCC domain-containing protein [Micromonospora purpureochromogenes]|uniref:SRPBCC family protein n=1 Tax=Micromonospora TaxID=1873 RepID=UPI001B380602|nr:SRPBCC domain-containing protein [Micromonospora sp. U56]MBQ0895842.1 SRPBCC domain-containing protein [Micromonospora sp. U56]